jgi:hypothetical protein
MSRLKVCLLALACVAAVREAGAADETWQLKSARGRFAFYPELMRSLGIGVTPASAPDARERISADFEAAGSLELKAPGSLFRDVGSGELRLASATVLRMGATEVPLQGLALQRGPDERTLEVIGDGRVLFVADHMHFAVDRPAGRIRFFNLGVRLAAEAARALGDERFTGMAVAVLELEGPVAIPAGSVEQPDGACVNPNWGLPDNDAALINIGSVDQMALSGGLVAIAPSASVANVGVTDVPWYDKFSGNFPPYNNDQHPFLSWNMYRIAGGALEQIGISPLKHAFFTINDVCGCPGGQILWVNCQDTYGSFTNDDIFFLTLRPEVTAFTGVWKRCGSIFDPDCNGVQDNPPARANPMDRRMAVAATDMQTAGAVYYIEAWYLIRDDTNIFNTMGWRTVVPHVVTGGNWSFTPLGPMNTGPVIDQWVNPGSPGPNAQSVSITTAQGKLRLAVRATNLGGQWRYDYGLMNFDFDPKIRSFSVPLPPGVVVSNVGFSDPDQDPATDWTATVTSSAVTWTTPSAAAAQDWGSLFSFHFTTNTAPTPPGGATVTMRVQAAKPGQLQAAIIGPGAPTEAAAEKR